MAKLQLALDTLNLPEALALLDEIHSQIDIVEVGTPFIMRDGMSAVRKIKGRFPSLDLLCDGKIVDAGDYETACMLDAGADWVTVMAFTDDYTIVKCVQTAHKRGKFVMADLLCVTDVRARAKELAQLDVDCVAVHTGVDQQKLGRTPLDDLRSIRSAVVHAMTAVAGGISLDSLSSYLRLEPDILIVGSGILSQPDPAETARAFRKALQQLKSL